MAVTHQQASGWPRLTVAVVAVTVGCALWTGAASVQTLLVVLAGASSLLYARFSASALAGPALDPSTPRSKSLAMVAKGVVGAFVWPALLAALVASLNGSREAPDVDFTTAWIFFGVLGTCPYLWFLRSALRSAQQV